MAEHESGVDFIPIAERPVERNQQITVAGYTTADKDLVTATLEVESYDGDHDTWVLNVYKGAGMSGGPALRDDRLVGIVQARDTDRNSTYIIPTSAFRDLLDTATRHAGGPSEPDGRDSAPSISHNPYHPWDPVTPPRFCGREGLFRHLEAALEERRSVSLVGDWRIGKSSVLLTWKERAECKGRVARWLSREGTEAATLAAFVEAATASSPAGDEADAAADRLSRWAEQSAPAHLPPLILVDEVDGILPRFPHRFFERLRGMLDRICLVFASRREIDEIYAGLDRTSPFHNRLELNRLGLIEPAAAEQIVALGKHWFSAQDGKLLRLWAGRHPFHLQLLGHHLVNARIEGRSEQHALDAYLDEAAARLRELWGTLSPRDQQALRRLLAGEPVARRTLRARRLVTDNGQAFGRVLETWLQENS